MDIWKPKTTNKPWGKEELLIKTDKYAVKRIKINAGHRMSLQYHELKEETIYVLDGILIVWKSKEMEDLIKKTRKKGDTVGGVISCIVSGVPVGLGEPVFDKLHAELGKAMLSINAVKGFEFGSGFKGSEMNGSEHNDSFNEDGSTKTNYSGGVQGGISNGMDIYFNIAFKPVSTIMRDQDSIDSKGKKVKVQGKGRHDPCVVPRAVPIVEAMAALVIADYLLLSKLSKI